MKWIVRNVEELLACVGLSSTLLLVVVNVFLRYFFRSSIVWAEEIAVIGFVWVIFMGTSAGYKRRMHIGIDVIVNLLPPRLKSGIIIGVDIFLLIVNAYMTYLGIVYSISATAKLTAVLRIPYSYINSSIAISFGFMTFHSLIFLLNDLKSVTLPGSLGRFFGGRQS